MHVKEFFTRYTPQKRYYFALICVIFINTLIEKVGAIYWGLNHYTYEYGLINPWIRIHNSKSLGMNSLVYMLRNSDMGVEWIPQYIFIDAALIYFSMAIINFVYKKLSSNNRK